MTFNSLLMFDIVFVFFLFLVGVTCLVYYLPPNTRKSSGANFGQNMNSNNLQNSLRYRNYHHNHNYRTNHNHPHLYDNYISDCDEYKFVRSSNKSCRCVEKPSEFVQIEIERHCPAAYDGAGAHSIGRSSSPLLASTSASTTSLKENYTNYLNSHTTKKKHKYCYVKAKNVDIKECRGPVFDV